MGHENLPNFINVENVRHEWVTKKYQTAIKFIENVGHEWDTKNYGISLLMKMWDMNGTRKFTEFHFC